MFAYMQLLFASYCKSNWLACHYVAEIMNLRNLERVLAREEEVKKRAIVHKAVYSGPQIKYISKDGNLLSI